MLKTMLTPKSISEISMKTSPRKTKRAARRKLFGELVEGMTRWLMLARANVLCALIGSNSNLLLK